MVDLSTAVTSKYLILPLYCYFFPLKQDFSFFSADLGREGDFITDLGGFRRLLPPETIKRLLFFLEKLLYFNHIGGNK